MKNCDIITEYLNKYTFCIFVDILCDQREKCIVYLNLEI